MAEVIPPVRVSVPSDELWTLLDKSLRADEHVCPSKTSDAALRTKVRRLGRDYGRASATIHALRAENALLREDRAALEEDAQVREREVLDANRRAARAEAATNVVGGGSAVDLGAAPKAGAATPDDYLLADHIRAAVEQLARQLHEVAMPSVEWDPEHARFNELFTGYAWTVAAAGWRPPVVLAEPTRVQAIARVLVDHDMTVEDDCRCGWRGDPLFHFEHVAVQLLALGVVA